MSDDRVPSEARMREFVVTLKRWVFSIQETHRRDVAMDQWLAAYAEGRQASCGIDPRILDGKPHVTMADLDIVVWETVDHIDFRSPWGWPDDVREGLAAARRPGTSYHISRFVDQETGSRDFDRAARRVAEIETRVAAFVAAVDDALAPSSAPTTSPTEATGRKRRGGRPADPKVATLAEQWKDGLASGRYADMAGMAEELGVTRREIQKAVDSHRRRGKP